MSKEINKDDLAQVLKDFLESGEGTEPMAMSGSEEPDYSLVKDAEYLICSAFRKAEDQEVKALAGEAMVKLRELLAQSQGNVFVVTDA